MRIRLGGSLLLVLATVAVARGSGNRLLAQSTPSTALGGACVAQVTGPDTAYWNPANMPDLKVGQGLEFDVHYVYVPSQVYDDRRSDSLSGESNALHSLRPTFFYTSKSYSDFRFGLSLVTPFGLSKEWDDPYPATFATEYSVQVFELNPAISYRLNDMLSLGFGVRGVYAHATVKSAGQLPPKDDGVYLVRDIDGDDVTVGYNVALTVKPLDSLRVGVTYRSKLRFDLQGDAFLYSSLGRENTYDGSGSVEYYLPAVLALGVAYSFQTLTVELLWDRTYWSSYEELDFEYENSLGNPYLQAAFDTPIVKDWQDTDAFHLGVTWVGFEGWIIRAGITIDETPVPDQTLNFEMADSDYINYSFGLQYELSTSSGIALAYIFTDKEDRQVVNSSIDGDFSEGSAHTVSLGWLYSF